MGLAIPKEFDIHAGDADGGIAISNNFGISDIGQFGSEFLKKAKALFPLFTRYNLGLKN
jgi:hypothetical protein